MQEVGNDKNRALLEAVNATGKTFLVSTGGEIFHFLGFSRHRRKDCLWSLYRTTYVVVSWQSYSRLALSLACSCREEYWVQQAHTFMIPSLNCRRSSNFWAPASLQTLWARSILSDLLIHVPTFPVLYWTIRILQETCRYWGAPKCAELDGKVVLRLAVGAASTQMRHVQAVWDLLSKEAQRLQD